MSTLAGHVAMCATLIVNMMCRWMCWFGWRWRVQRDVSMHREMCNSVNRSDHQHVLYHRYYGCVCISDWVLCVCYDVCICASTAMHEYINVDVHDIVSVCSDVSWTRVSWVCVYSAQMPITAWTLLITWMQFMNVSNTIPTNDFAILNPINLSISIIGWTSTNSNSCSHRERTRMSPCWKIMGRPSNCIVIVCCRYWQWV